ncbi:MAG: hypothetical protein HGB12_08475, partial [Bacteroidetes bacterium]|nr:hypothetical protein [Bacteroidota bacterium]
MKHLSTHIRHSVGTDNQCLMPKNLLSGLRSDKKNFKNALFGQTIFALLILVLAFNFQVKSQGHLNVKASTNFVLSNNAVLSLSGNLINNGNVITKTPSTDTDTLKFCGTTAQVISGSGTNTLKNLKLKNSSGLTLSNAVTVEGSLFLTNGILTTTSTNILSITNNSNTAIVSPSTTRYIDGPLKWTLASGTAYSFPVGKGGTYYPFALTPTGTAPIIQVEAFNADCGGTALPIFSSLSTSEYWSASVSSGTFTDGVIGLTRQAALGTLNAIGRSATINGTYTNLNGTVSGTSIINSDATGSSLGFFVMATECVPPTPSISGSATACVGQTGSVYSVSGTGNTYAWTVTGGSITAGAGTPEITITWGTGSSGTVDITETKGDGCSAVATQKAVTINALPTPGITPTAAVCENTTGNVYTTESGKSSYDWTVTGGSITAGGGTGDNTATVTWGAAGTGHVKVNYTSNGCTAASQTDQSITINALPTAQTITGSASVCADATGSVYSVTNNSGNAYSWSVSGCTITAGQNSNSITVSWCSTPGTGTVDVTETISATGCSVAATQKEVTINALPTPGITPTAAVCENTTGNVYTTESGKSNYDWDVTGGSITSGGGTGDNTATITWGSAGTGNVKVNYTSNGCSAASQTDQSITINGLPTPGITPTSAVCANSTGNVYTTESGKSSYDWDVTGGSITSGGGTGDNTATVTWGSAGPGHVKVNYTSNGCSAVSQTDQSITINGLPTPGITPTAAVCANSTGNVYTTESSKTSYDWDITGGTVTAGGTTGDNTITITWGSAGTGNVKVNYTDINGCTAASQTDQSITINALPTPGITPTSAVCENSTGNVYTTESGKTSYSWTVTGGSITSGGGTGDNTVTVTWGATSPGHVKVNYTSNGCTAASQTDQSITINGLPTPTIDPTAAVCAGSTGNVYTTESGKSNYSWTVTGGSITSGGGSGDNTATITWGGVGTGHVKVNYSSNGCAAASQTDQSITIKLTPAAPTASDNGPVYIGSPLTLAASTVSGASYAWTGPESYSNGTQNPTVSSSATLLMAGSYCVVATVNGCASSAGCTSVSVIDPDAVTAQCNLHVKTTTNLVLSKNIVISLAGNLINNGIVATKTPATDTDTIKLRGTSLQEISGTGTNTFKNVKLDNTAGLKLSNDVTVEGNLLLTNGVLSIGEKTLTLKDTLTIVSGSLKGGTSSNLTVADGGSANNLVLPAITNGLKKLTINRTQGATLSTNYLVNDTLKLTSGALKLNKKTLVLNNPDSLAITRTSGVIISESNDSINQGIIQWNIGTTASEHIIPFGTDTTEYYIPVKFKNSGDVGNMSFSTRPTGKNNRPFAPGVANMVGGPTDVSQSAVIDRWWDFNSTLGHTLPPVDLTLSYEGSDNTTNYAGTFGFQHWQVDTSVTGGGYWNNGKGGNPGTISIINITQGAATAGHTYSFKTTDLTQFSDYIIVKSNSPLPVELLGFTASCNNETINIEWSTASETNNDYFTLEKSYDVSSWSTVAVIDGMGNSNTITNYTYTDTLSLPDGKLSKVKYYRLKQ